MPPLFRCPYFAKSEVVFRICPWAKLDQILVVFIVVQLQSCSWKGTSQKGKCSSNYWFSGNMLVFRRVLQLWDLNNYSDSSFKGEVKALMICAKGCSLEKKHFVFWSLEFCWLHRLIGSISRYLNRYKVLYTLGVEAGFLPSVVY